MHFWTNLPQSVALSLLWKIQIQNKSYKFRIKDPIYQEWNYNYIKVIIRKSKLISLHRIYFLLSLICHLGNYENFSWFSTLSSIKKRRNCTLTFSNNKLRTYALSNYFKKAENFRKMTCIEVHFNSLTYREVNFFSQP